MERYCRRSFESQSRTKVFPVNQLGYLFLDAWPLDRVTRIQTGKQSVISLTTTADVANFAVTETSVQVTKIVSGTTTTTDLLFATYPTLTTLVAALPSGFAGTVQGNFGSFPSADLVAGQCGSPSATLSIWRESSSLYQAKKNGIVSLDQQTFWSDSNGNLSTEARVTWTGGYSSIPEDLQEVCAAMTIVLYGEFAFSVAKGQEYLAKLPESKQAILASYRDRGF